MQKRQINLYIIVVLALLLYFSKLIYLLLPDMRMWGISHLQFLPVPYTIIYLGCFVILCFLFIPKINSLAVRIFENLSNIFAGKKYLKWAVVSLVCIPIFWLFRMPANFLGDGYTIINNIGNELPVIYKWTEMGVIAVADFVNNLLPYSGLQSANYAHAIMSVVSGAVSIYFFFGIAYELTENKTYRLFILTTLIFSGWTLLFFGYVENYPLLWASMTGYMYFSIKYMNKKCSLIWPTLLLIVCHIIHLQSMFFAISFPLLLVSRDPFRRIYHQNKKVILSIASIVILSGVAIFLYKYFHSLSFQAHFLPLLKGRPPADNYTIISIPHFVDILNQYSLLIPIWPIFLYLCIRSYKSTKKDSIWKFLVSFSLGGLILILILDPRIGMGRDWDLFALCGLGPALLFLKTIELSKIKIKKYYPALALLSLLLMAPFFIVNLQYQPSINYFSSLLELDWEKSRSGMATLRDYYNRSGENEKANDINQRMRALFPNISLVKQGRQFIQAQKTDKALNVAERIIQNEPNKSSGYSLRGMAYLMMRQFEKALDDFNVALELDPYYAYNHMNLGQYYYYYKDFNQSIKQYREALALEPGSHSAYRGMGNSFYGANQYDSGLVYFEKAIAIAPDVVNNYKMAGYCAHYTGNKAKTKRYLSYYLENVPNDLERDAILQMLKTAMSEDVN